MKKIFVLLNTLSFILFVSPISIFAQEKENINNFTTREIIEEITNSTIFQEVMLFSDDYTAINVIIDNTELTCPCGVTSGSQELHIADVHSSSGLNKVCYYCGCLLPSTGSEIYPGINSFSR